MSDKENPEQLSIDERLAKLQRRRMEPQQNVPPTHKEITEETASKVEQPSLTWQRAGQPLTHDRRSRIPFNDRYYKDNIMVDKRLLPYYLHFLEQCRSKVEGANTMLLEFLISKGYQIDPHLLEKPFKWEDVPQPPKE